jgi:hypothetical protein
MAHPTSSGYRKLVSGSLPVGPVALRILVLSKNDLANSLNFLMVPVAVVTGPSNIRLMGRKPRKHIEFTHYTDSERLEKNRPKEASVVISAPMSLTIGTCQSQSDSPGKSHVDSLGNNCLQQPQNISSTIVSNGRRETLPIFDVYHNRGI